jgi:hypothetical protein
VNVSISCPKAAGLCDGRVRLAVGKSTRGSSSFLVNGGRNAVLRLRLSAAAINSAIRRKKVNVSVFSRDNAGAATLTQKSVKFVK